MKTSHAGTCYSVMLQDKPFKSQEKIEKLAEEAPGPASPRYSVETLFH